jgi:hypothetical protein
MKLKTRRRLGTTAFAIGLVTPVVVTSLRSQPAYVCHYDQLAGNPCPATGPGPGGIIVAVVLVVIGIVLLAPWWLHWLVGRPAPKDPDPPAEDET